jgi:hypothetical protein
MTINPFSPILDTAVGNVIQVLSNSTVAPPSAGTIAFSNSQFSVNENGIPITQVTLTRTGGSTGAVSATLNLSNGTATAGNDYIQTPIIVTFADGETSKTVNLTQASQGLSFDGIDSYVSLPASSLGGAITIEAWVYADDSHRYWQRIIDFGNGDANNNIVLGWRDTSGKMFLHSYQGNTTQEILTNEVFPENQWVHVAAVIDINGNASVYWNGQVKSSGFIGNPPTLVRNNLYIGRSNLDCRCLFCGQNG